MNLDVALILGVDGLSLPLLALTAPRKGLFGAKPPAKTPEYLAALHALGAYSADPRARAIREGAARSRDPEIAAAAGGRTQ